MPSKVQIPTNIETWFQEHCGSRERDSHVNEQHEYQDPKALRGWILGHASHCMAHSTPCFLRTPFGTIAITSRTFSPTF